jgi:NAD(P)-dependent dehydrogenase (short-subunit alcohol dehydrogenase family)
MAGFGAFNGRVAVITGGASGIGLAMARRFRAEGMQVMIGDIDEEALASAAAETGALARRCDVSRLGDLEALAAASLEAYGRVDLLCNNAGVGPAGRLSDLTIADWKWLLDINLWGVIYGIHAFLPILRGNPDGGWIVNTSSMGGLSPVEGLGAYVTAKFGVTGLTETLAAELATEGAPVGVTLLCPGPVRSNLSQSMRHRTLAEGERAGLADVDVSAMAHYRSSIPLAPGGGCRRGGGGGAARGSALRDHPS